MSPYQAEDARLRTLFALRGFTDPEDQSEESIKLRFIDEYASTILIQRWLAEKMTWKRLSRVAFDHPGNGGAQIAELRKTRKRA